MQNLKGLSQKSCVAREVEYKASQDEAAHPTLKSNKGDTINKVQPQKQCPENRSTDNQLRSTVLRWHPQRN
jgi:hypothetical protein